MTRKPRRRSSRPAARSPASPSIRFMTARRMRFMTENHPNDPMRPIAPASMDPEVVLDLTAFVAHCAGKAGRAEKGLRLIRRRLNIENLLRLCLTGHGRGAQDLLLLFAGAQSLMQSFAARQRRAETRES